MATDDSITMSVTVKLYGNLKRFAPNKRESARVELLEQMSVRALLDSLGVPENSWWMAAVNDQVVDDTTILHDGDDVEVFEPVGGGRAI